MIKPDKLYRISEVAKHEFLGLDRRAISKLITSGELVSVKWADGEDGRPTIRIKGSDLMKFIEAKRTVATDQMSAEAA
ncbi:MAG: helix-turn-helix domain-containing protein [Calditrichia bacterium]